MKCQVLEPDARMGVSIRKSPPARRNAFKMGATPFLPFSSGRREVYFIQCHLPFRIITSSTILHKLPRINSLMLKQINCSRV